MSKFYFLIAFVFVGSHLAQSQVPHPSHQSSLKGSGALLFTPNAVFVSGNLAFVISWNDNSLVLVDISDPNNPVVQSTVQIPTPLCVYASGNYAYVGNFLGNGYSFMTIDITDPANPVIKGSIKDGDGGAIIHYPTSIFVAGDYAYVTNAGEESLEILDITNADQPTHVGKIQGSVDGALLGYPASVVVSGDYAYIASAASNALEIVDVSQPDAPAFVSRLVSGTGGAVINDPFSVFVSGNYAFLTSNSYLPDDGKNALEIVDISDPANPIHAGKIANGDGGAALFYPHTVVVSGDFAYVASQFSSALEVVDVSDPTVPVHAGSLTNGSGGAMLKGPSSVAISSHFAYVASTGSNALEVVDVTVPSTPLHAGSLVDGAGGNGANLNLPNAVFVSGKYAYVATANALEIVDVSHPDVPSHTGVITNGANGAMLDFPTSAFVSGNYAYLTNYSSNSLEIVDVTNPNLPMHQGSITDGTGGAVLKVPTSVFVSGKYAYITAQNSSALEIIDVSNPATPTHAGNIYATPLYFGPILYALISPTSVFVLGNYAYVVGSGALEILDISNPILPQHKSSMLDGDGGAVLNSPQSIYVKGNYAYVACYTGAVEIIDISNPSAPVHVASISDGEGGAVLYGAQSISVWEQYACVVGKSKNTLEVIDISNPAAPAHAASITNASGGALLNQPASVFFLNKFAYVASFASNALEIISIIAPGAPVALPASNTTVSSFNAVWNRSIGAIGYQLDVSTDNFQTFLPGFNSVNTSDTILNIPGLTSGTVYQYRVRAYNASGASVNSNTISVITIPSAPHALTASITTSNSFRASWNSARGAGGYQLDVSMDNFQTFLSGFNSMSISDTTLTITGLTPVTAYQYRVRAYNASGASLNSNTISLVTILSTPNALPAFMVTSNSFRAHWSNSVGATGYQLDVSQDNFQTFLSGFNSKDVLDTTLNITGLISGTGYQYRVRAYDASDTSINSNLISLITIPPSPKALPASIITSSSFKANWNSSRGAAGYQLDVSQDNFQTYLTKYNSVLVADTALDIAGILSGETYQYRVRSYNNWGLSANSNVISNVVTGVIEATPPVLLYPNPAASYVFISGITSPVPVISVIDNLGRSFPLEFEVQDKLVVCNLHHLTTGVYVVVISGDAITHRIKLVKK